MKINSVLIIGILIAASTESSMSGGTDTAPSPSSGKEAKSITVTTVKITNLDDLPDMPAPPFVIKSTTTSTVGTDPVGKTVTPVTNPDGSVTTTTVTTTANPDGSTTTTTNVTTTINDYHVGGSFTYQFAPTPTGTTLANLPVNETFTQTTTATDAATGAPLTLPPAVSTVTQSTPVPSGATTDANGQFTDSPVGTTQDSLDALSAADDAGKQINVTETSTHSYYVTDASGQTYESTQTQTINYTAAAAGPNAGQASATGTPTSVPAPNPPPPKK